VQNKILFDEVKRYIANYKQCVTDIQFLNSCISEHVKNLNLTHTYDSYFDSNYYIHNIGPNADLQLKKYQHGKHTIDAENITEWQNNLLSNINVIHIVKMYNAIERLMILAIRDNFFQFEKITSKLQNKIDSKIVETGYNDKKNNKHIIEFLKGKSEICKEFLTEKINIYQTITWEHFFQLLSILRNSIAHNGGYIDKNITNHLKSIDKKFADLYFNFENDRIQIKDNMQFALSFFGKCDKFTINLIKFIYNKTDLDFLCIK
jgi:hypothetical protein